MAMTNPSTNLEHARRPPRPWGRWAIASVIVLVLALAPPLRPAPAVSQAPGHPTNIDNLVRNFERIAFREDPSIEEWSTIQRWTGPISAVLVGDGGAEYRGVLRGLFSQLEALTGLEFKVPEADSAATTEVFFPNAIGIGPRPPGALTDRRPSSAFPTPAQTFLVKFSLPL